MQSLLIPAKNLSEIKTGYFTNGKDTYYARI